MSCLLLSSILDLSELGIVVIHDSRVVFIKYEHRLDLLQAIQTVRRKILFDVLELRHLFDLNTT